VWQLLLQRISKMLHQVTRSMGVIRKMWNVTQQQQQVVMIAVAIPLAGEVGVRVGAVTAAAGAGVSG
jgi:hypothetical protein